MFCFGLKLLIFLSRGKSRVKCATFALFKPIYERSFSPQKNMEGEKMPIFREEKTTNFTIMSNTHLREEGMSLKAKGLFSLMLTLPNDWEFSINGLCSICKESKGAIISALNELKKFGYLETRMATPDETENRKIRYEYYVFERPRRRITEDEQ